ncbi:hypothetical protein ACWXWU_03990 [Shewanella sp. A14]
MKELTINEINEVNGGFFVLAAAAYAAYQAGKLIGADVMKFMKAS